MANPANLAAAAGTWHSKGGPALRSRKSNQFVVTRLRLAFTIDGVRGKREQSYFD